MMYAKAPHRLGTTAIAVVIALTATPLFAQSMEMAPADAATPVLVTPPPVTAPQPAEQTAAPQTSTGVVTAPVIAATSTASNLSQTPRVEIEPTPEAAPAASRPASPAPRIVRTGPATASATEAAPRAVAPAPVAAPIPAPAAAPVPVMEATEKPAAPAPQPVAPSGQGDDILPVAGVAGLGALALIGGALALRRRRNDEDVIYDEPAFETETMPEPLVAAPIATAPVYARDLNGPAAAAPDRAPAFDTSRFGRHVQAAYRGPTPENPSLSLKKRLKRASFWDQRERMAAMPQATPLESPAIVTTMDRAPVAAPRRPEPAPRPTRQPNFRPAFQS